jgi:hypothetical protein
MAGISEFLGSIVIELLIYFAASRIVFTSPPPNINEIITIMNAKKTPSRVEGRRSEAQASNQHPTGSICRLVSLDAVDYHFRYAGRKKRAVGITMRGHHHIADLLLEGISPKLMVA